MIIDPRVYGACPNLAASDHRWTSPDTISYNCIAHAADDLFRWWEPLPMHLRRLLPKIYYWPPGLPLGIYTVENYAAAYATLGYEPCGMDGSFEEGYEKVAIYWAKGTVTHAAKQLGHAEWSSKAGDLQDFSHDSPTAVADGGYGTVALYMKRQVQSN